MDEHYRTPDYESGCGLAFLIGGVFGVIVLALAVVGMFRIIEVLATGG